MQERARELKAASRSRGSKADGTSDLLAKIAEKAEPDRAMAEWFLAQLPAKLRQRALQWPGRIGWRERRARRRVLER